MESKALLIALFCLIGGLAVGYFVNSLIVQNQFQAKDLQIQKLQTTIDELQATITQNLTQVKVDSEYQVNFGPEFSDFNVTIRNTGTVPARIQSISIRRSVAGSEASIWTAPANSNIEAERLITLHFLGKDALPLFTWSPLLNYLVRVTTTTGYYYELEVSAPFMPSTISIDTYSIPWETSLQVYVRNIGKTTFSLQYVYIDGEVVTNFTPLTLSEGQVKLTTITYDAGFGTTIHVVKLVGIDNTQLSFQVKK